MHTQTHTHTPHTTHTHKHTHTHHTHTPNTHTHTHTKHTQTHTHTTHSQTHTHTPNTHTHHTRKHTKTHALPDLRVNVKWFYYRPCVTQRVGRVIALLLQDRGTRRGWVVSITPRPHFTPGKDSVPNLQETGWAPGPVWKGGNSSPHRVSLPHRPAR